MDATDIDIDVAKHGPQIRLRVFAECKREMLVRISGSASALRKLADELRRSTDGKPELKEGRSSESLFLVVSDNPHSYPKDMCLCFDLESSDEGKRSFEIMAKQDAFGNKVHYAVLLLAIIGVYTICRFLWNVAF